jgi:hypothetical protein
MTKLKSFSFLDLIHIKSKLDNRKKLAYEWLNETTSDTRKEEIEDEIDNINKDLSECLQLTIEDDN